MALTTPVLLLVYNRVQYLSQIIDVLTRVKPTTLYIVADGPKPNLTDAQNCKEVRDYLDSHINWECQVKKLYRKNNLGCRHGVSEGITWFFSQVKEGIILEDDCIPDVSFFPYCSELLCKYRSNQKVLSISGNNFHEQDSSSPDSYYFSHYPNIWGWATWKRAWDLYDVNISDWPTNYPLSWLNQIIPNRLIAQYYAQTFNDVRSKKIDTWDYQFTFLHFKQDGLSIIPRSNLVQNVGFSQSATHTKTKTKLSLIKVHPIAFPLIHPTHILSDKHAEYLTNLPILENPLGVASLFFRLLRSYV